MPTWLSSGRARPHLADRLLGTVAPEVTKRAGCDVLIVRPEHEHGEPDVLKEDVPSV